MSGGKGGGSQTVSSRVDIPGFLTPLVNQQAGVASGALNQLQGSDFTANLTPDQLRSLELSRGVAEGAGGFLPVAQEQFLQTARGDYLDSDAFNNAFQSALRQAQPGISSAFSLAGRSGSGLEATAQSQAAANAFASLLGQERQLQMQAAQQLPGIALAPAAILEQAGGVLQAQQQNELDAPLRMLQAAGGPVPLGSLLGSSQQQPYFGSNPLLSGLGGAATGAGIGGTFGNPAIGAGIGGLIGLLG